MKLCVAYCRVSTDKEDQKNSIEAQKEQWRELFAQEGYNPANCGLLYKKDGNKEQVKGIFADEGISGTSLRKRKAFESMMEYAKKKAFDVIYVEDISRFTRSVEDGVKVIKDLRELGIGVHFRKENINSLNADKDLEITIRLGFYQDESRVKSERIKWAIHRLHMKGGWNSTAPYGYDIEEGFLQVNGVEAEVIRKVFDLFVNEGYGIYKVAKYLNLNEIPTKKGVKWGQKQISFILENVLYTGEQRTHTVENVDINRKIVVDVAEEEQIVHHFEHLRIVDSELFRLAQLERERRYEMHNKHTGHSNTHLLSSLLYCWHCGGNYKRKKRHSYTRKDGTLKDIGYEWTCAINDMYGKSRCEHRNMLIEDDVIEQIKLEIAWLKANSIDGWFELYLMVKYEYDVSQERYDILVQQKKRLAREMEILRGDFVDGILESAIYKEQMKALNEKAVGLAAEITRIDRHDIEIDNAKLRYKQFMEYVRGVDLNNLTNTALKRIFKNITVKGLILEDGRKAKTLIYNYYCMDMSIEDIINKAQEKGYKVKKVDLKRMAS